jgi:hypothetical protein
MDLDRVGLLERKVARLQRVTVILAAGFLLLLVWRLLPGPAAIDAREFRLRDGHGVIRGALTMLDEHRPVLRLNDENGKARAMLYLNRERGGTFRLTDPDGVNRLSLLLTEDGWPEVRLDDPVGRTRTRLGLTGADRPALSVGDSLGGVWNTPLRAEALRAGAR